MALQQWHFRAIFLTNTDRSSKVTNGFTAEWTDVGSDPGPSDISDLATAVQDFYNVAADGMTQTMSKWMGPQIDRGAEAASVTATNITGHLDGSPAGSPYAEYPFTLTDAAGGAGIPDQVCLVCSFRSNYGTDPEFGSHVRPRADDRNRIYFGPLITASVAADEESPPNIMFTGNILSDATIAMAAFSVQVAGLTSWQWVRWSRKNAAVAQVVDTACDLVPDTQRRRATKRSNLVWSPLP